MKKLFIQISVIVMLVAGLTGCQTTAYVDRSAYSAGGGRGVVSAPRQTRFNSAEVFRNQPVQPTAAAWSNPTIWGATASTAYWYNDMRNGTACVQPVSPNEPVLVDRANGWIWRPKCGNSVAPYTPPQEEVVATSAVVPQDVTVVQGPNPCVETIACIIGAFIPRIDVNFVPARNGYSGGYCGGYRQQSHRQYYPQPQRYCPPPVRYDRCGRPVRVVRGYY